MVDKVVLSLETLGSGSGERQAGRITADQLAPARTSDHPDAEIVFRVPSPGWRTGDVLREWWGEEPGRRWKVLHREADKPTDTVRHSAETVES